MTQLDIRRLLELAIQGLIFYSLVTLALETMPELSAYGRFFQISEGIVVGLFTVEYIARWASSRDKLRYPFSFLAIVDLLAIVPFYISLGFDLRSIRAVRFLRLFRILKLGRYSEAMRTLGEAFRRTGPELTAFGFVGSIVIVLSAIALYYAEHEAQPAVYSSIPASLWWAVVTLTTVGYGDVSPQTLVGKMVASVVMLMGIGLVAVPTGLLSSAMTDILRDKAEASRGRHGKKAPPSREESLASTISAD